MVQGTSVDEPTMKRLSETEQMRQDIRSALSASLMDGRLSDALQSVKEKKEREQLRAARLDVRRTLQESLADGSLFEAMKKVKGVSKLQEEKTSRQRLPASMLESMRQDL